MQFNNLLLSTHLEAQQDLGGGKQRVGFSGIVIAIGFFFYYYYFEWKTKS